MRYSTQSLICVVTAVACLCAIARFNLGLSVFAVVIGFALLSLKKWNVIRTYGAFRFIVAAFVLIALYAASAGPQAAAVRAVYAYGPQPDWVDTWLLTGMRPLYETSKLPIVGPVLVAYCDHWDRLGIQIRRFFVPNTGRYERPSI